ncbi:LLM class flavin-dependent oxidoreductase [Nonomuraea cavernae]|uniref:Monooxygenase n=1 Tax=Nonomuraea cavernae TaxID=2045107 RepID=A0A918DFP0_9ACTN|nr:LLM class flavin-dependent oxidoreductase [Nonomuraea cavernae]MCA2183589.1 LLM class flavin-dependent oxidoreductase [Nonomuraea cavernae]GGO60757.1 monooxygenase [Nonomuraea cavernae]
MSVDSRSRQMSLAAYVMVPTAHHHGAWRHHDADLGFLDAHWWIELARIYERGRFDMLFLPDLLAIPDQAGGYEATVSKGSQGAVQLDPLVTLAAVCAHTTHLGLGITRSVSFHPPYDIARSMATLDHLSGGRAAWNIVTTSMRSAALNFGQPLPERNERYDRGDEVIEACIALWESWAGHALVADKESGVFADPGAVSRPDYQGKWISVRGPLSVPRSPQGRPVLMQAGASERGRRFAARWGEVIFALQHSLPDMQAFYRDIKSRARNEGRDPDQVKILTGVQVVVAETAELAEVKRRELEALIDPVAGLLTLSYQLGIDLSDFPLDDMLEAIDDVPGTRGSLDVVLQGTKAEGLTLREAAVRYATSELTPQIVGDADQVADELERLFVNEGCDGFIVTPGPLPASATDFVDLVVPVLQRRGLFRTEYEGRTLRHTMGLSPL